MLWPIIGLVLDQLTKLLVTTRLALGGSFVSFGPFSFTRFENGAGPMSLPIPAAVLLAASVLVLGAIGWLLWHERHHHLNPGYAWIFWGGVSNLIDRLARGLTVDYIGLPFGGYWNLADVMILVGLVLIVVGGWRKKEKSEQS